MPTDNPPPEIDLEPLQKAVNEAASRVRGLWLGFIALLAYLFIAVGAVTHRDLLLENSVQLPVLNVELPLIGFFAIAPILLLINHFYLLLQLMGLGRRIREFNDEIKKTDLGEEARRRERRKLDTFVIVQMLGGTREERELLTGKFLKFIAMITLVIAPVALLLFIQLQFLPYQYELVTWWHRIVLAGDLALLWVFWPSIKLGDWAPWLDKLRVAAVCIVLLFAYVIATFPGEIVDSWTAGKVGKNWSRPQDSFLWSTKGLLFGDLSAGKERKRWIPFSRALDLPDDKTLIDLDKFDTIKKRHAENKDQTKPWNQGRTRYLRERNLRGAMFDRSDLRHVDLFTAQLQGASLVGAILHGASLDFAELQGASLAGAGLQDALLKGATLHGASLGGAILHGASLGGAILHGASLDYAELQGASLDYAELQGASLTGAILHGASLDSAELQGASLDSAELQGASLGGAILQGAVLDGAILHGASLDYAELQGASLTGAMLEDASLENTFLWWTYGKPNPENLEHVWVDEPRIKALEPKQLAELEQEVLAGVVDDEVGPRLKKVLERLKDEDAQDRLPDNYWTDAAGKTRKAEHQKDLADRLTELACDEENTPYVAQGLTQGISARLEAIGPTHLPRVARTLLDAAEGKTTDCPGAKGVGAASIANLRRWASEAENAGKTKQTAK